MTTKPKPIYPNQYSVKLSSEAGELLNKWIADFRHREGIHLTKTQAVMRLIRDHNETSEKGA